MHQHRFSHSPPAGIGHNGGPSEDVPPEYKAFRNAHSQFGGGAHVRKGLGGQHFIHMLTLAAPLVIGEIVHDSQKRWRYLRLCSLVGAVISEGLYQRSRQRDAEWER